MNRTIPYENVYIGIFIYSLGICVGAKPPTSDTSSVSLLQQTPVDTALGDLLGFSAGKYYLIEFKAERLDTKELERIQRLNNRLRASPNGHVLSRIAATCHFLGVGAGSESTTPVSLSPYVSAATGTKCSLQEFIEQVAGGSLGADPVGFGQYLDLLVGRDELGKLGTAGLLVHRSPTGRFSFLPYPSLPDLLWRLRQRYPARSAPSQQVAGVINTESSSNANDAGFRPRNPG